MNRQAKRMMARQQKAAPQDRAQAVRERKAMMPDRRRQRQGVRTFLKEVRAELRKVAWPSRPELVGYTIVVLISVVVLTSYTFGLDYVFSKTVLRVFGG